MNFEEKKTILLIEEDTQPAMTTAGILKDAGYAVITATTGDEGVQIAVGGAVVDLILIDVHLGGGMDGTEAAKQVLARTTLPIVFLASHSERMTLEKIRGITRYGYVDKTAGDVALLSSIEMAFELFEAHRRLTNELAERKRAEEALFNERSLLRTLIDNIPDSIYSKDIACRKTLANAAELHILGAASEAEIIGKDDFAFYPPEIAKGFFADDRSVLETGTPVLNREEYILTKDREKRWLLSSKLPLRDRDGKIIGLVGIGRDITERKLAEQLVRDMQRRESIVVLSSGIAHDFNNLLGSMMGNLSLAQAQLPVGHSAVKNMEKALAAIDRAAELTRQLLAYSGKGQFQNLAVDIASVVRDHAGLFSVSLPSNVKLVTHLPSTPVFVGGDPEQIKQVIVNLIFNGGEAIGDRLGVVSVSLAETTLGSDDLIPYGRITNTALPAGTYALLEVRDDGMGMSADTLNKIFDPFFTTKFTGRGLGLSAVLGIVHAHNGGLTVGSAEGTGTIFRLILPSVPPPAPGYTVSADAPPDAAPTARTVLIIDDERDIATMAQEILEVGNFSSVVEVNPVEGIAFFTRHRAEIGSVLLDLTMPEMSGKDVIAALQAVDPDVKVIVTSGYSEDEVVKKIGATKVSAFIQKPYRMQSLLETVRRVMT